VHAPPADKDSKLPIQHKADLKSEAESIALIASIKPTHLLHLAWTTETGACLTDPDNELWEKSGMAMVQAFHAAGGKRIVVSGTCAEYDWNFTHLSEDSTPTKPRNLYGKSKNYFREKLLHFSKETGLSSAWGRIFFVYGPGEDKRRLVASVITSLLAQLPAECTHGEQKRDYLHVQDVADALVALLSSEVQGTVNIGSGRAIRVKDLISAVADKLNGKDLIRLGARQAPPDDPPCLEADIKRLSKEVGFTPRISVDQGLDSTINWWRQTL
jgi:nucleoside-diphosphate-sugar epimerase